MMRKRGTNTSPVQVQRNTDAKERARDALELRLAGNTLAEIADALGYAGPSGVCKAIKKAVADIPAELANELRTMEEIRLDGMQMAIWDKAEAGDLKAIDRVLKIMDRRARLLGLDARRGSPVLVQTSPSPTIISMSDMDEEERKQFLSALKRPVDGDGTPVRDDLSSWSSHS